MKKELTKAPIELPTLLRKRIASTIKMSFACVMIMTTNAYSHPSPESTTVDTIPRAMVKRLAKLEDNLKRFPDDASTIKQLASLNMSAARLIDSHDHIDEAANLFLHLTELQPNSADAWFGLASARFGQHRLDEAIKHIRVAGRLAPENERIRSLIGDIHFAAGHIEEADLIYSSLMNHTLTLESLSRVAMIYDLKGNREKATSLMKDAIKAGQLLNVGATKIAWCYERLGDFLFESGQYKLATDEYQKALALQSDSRHAKSQLVLITAANGQLRKAEHQAVDLAEKWNTARAWVLAGRLAEQKGDHASTHYYEKAENTIKHEIEEEQFGHTRELVSLLLGRRQQIDMALKLAQLDLDSRQDPEGYELMAWALRLAGQNTEALLMIEKAINIAPRRASALMRASVINAENNRLLVAKQYRHAALKANPHVMNTTFSWPSDIKDFEKWSTKLSSDETSSTD